MTDSDITSARKGRKFGPNKPRSPDAKKPGPLPSTVSPLKGRKKSVEQLNYESELNRVKVNKYYANHSAELNEIARARRRAKRDGTFVDGRRKKVSKSVPWDGIVKQIPYMGDTHDTKRKDNWYKSPAKRKNIFEK